jgi:hypothetical protein
LDLSDNRQAGDESMTRALTVLALAAIVSADTWYIKPDGSDGADGTTLGDAWATFDYAMIQLSPSDTLLMADGVYYQTMTVTVSGEQGAPIVFRAVNDGQAVINGQGTRQTFLCQGTADNFLHDLVFEGFCARNSSKHVFKSNYCRRMVFRRISGKDAVDVEGNFNVFSWADDCENILVEDCIGSGTGRIIFSPYNCNYFTFRRCWARWKDNNYGSVRTVYALYGTGHSTIENCIATMEDDVPDTFVEGFKVNRRDGNRYGDSNLIVGCIAYNLSGPAYFMQGNEIISGNVNRHNVAVDCGYGVYQRNDDDYRVENFTVVGATERGVHTSPYASETNPAYDCAYRVNMTAQNVSIVAAVTGVSLSDNRIYLPAGCSGGPYYGTLDNDYVNVYGCTTDYLNVSGGSNNSTLYPAYDTDTYGKGAYCMVPAALAGRGESGEGIGAEVLYRYVDGLLTDEPLWPFPMEDRILAESGWSATWESDHGIWKTLEGVYGGLTQIHHAPTRRSTPTDTAMQTALYDIAGRAVVGIPTRGDLAHGLYLKVRQVQGCGTQSTAFVVR